MEAVIETGGVEVSSYADFIAEEIEAEERYAEQRGQEWGGGVSGQDKVIAAARFLANTLPMSSHERHAVALLRDAVYALEDVEQAVEFQPGDRVTLRLNDWYELDETIGTVVGRDNDRWKISADAWGGVCVYLEPCEFEVVREERGIPV